MSDHLLVPPWTLEQKVALTCSILFAQGHDSGLAGQITALTEERGTFVTQRLGLGFEEITASNLLRVNVDLEVIAGSGMPNPANRFHAWIYRARPEVRCIVHTHPLHVSALSMIGEPLQVAHMDACLLYDDIAHLPNWPGVPVGNEEGEIISAALGGRRALLLAHHGLVVAGQSVEEACVVALQCERAAKLQLMAMSAGSIKAVSPDLAREAHDWILQERRSQAAFCYYARRALRDNSNCIE